MKALKTIATTFCSVLILAVLLLTACNKEGPRAACFDKKLYEKYKDKFCNEDCPGVIGCDGKEYCNACIAARHGIRVR